MIKRKTINIEYPPLSLNWRNDELVDWVGGRNTYSLNGEFKHGNVAYSYRFDSAIQADNGVYVVLYEKLGTKGLLLKNSNPIREINRSFYHANGYEYPIAFLKLKNEEYAIVHCPNKYNLIEIELFESGKKLTVEKERKPNDCFHSRFSLNSDNTYLLNLGWVWHPQDIIKIYNIEQGLNENSVFDVPRISLPINSEICSAGFLDNDLIVVSSTNEEPYDDDDMNDAINLNPRQMGLYSIAQNKFIKKTPIDFAPGTIIPVNEDLAIDLYNHPKLVDLNTGKVVQQFEDINSGKQNSSICHHIGKIPPIAIDQAKKRVAIGGEKTIELLMFDEINF